MLLTAWHIKGLRSSEARVTAGSDASFYTWHEDQRIEVGFINITEIFANCDC